MTSHTGPQQVELKPQTIPRVRAENGCVRVRLELVALNDPSQVQDIELVLDGNTQRCLRLNF
jgi:hypothetical protein